MRLRSRCDLMFTVIDWQITTLQQYSGGYAHCGSTVGDVCKHDRIGAYPHVVPNSDASKNLRACPDPNVVAYDWSGLLIPADANCDFLIDSDVLANHAAVVEDNTKTVMAEVNISSSYLGLVRNEATKPKPQELLDEEWQQRNSPAIQSIRCPVYMIRKI